MSREQLKAWVKFAAAAITQGHNYTTAAEFADSMLAEFDKRFDTDIKPEFNFPGPGQVSYIDYNGASI